MTKVLRKEPLKRAEGYTIDTYCKYKDGTVDHDYGGGATFFGHDKATAYSAARKRGWILHQDGTSTCPSCAGKP